MLDYVLGQGRFSQGSHHGSNPEWPFGWMDHPQWNVRPPPQFSAVHWDSMAGLLKPEICLSSAILLLLLFLTANHCRMPPKEDLRARAFSCCSCRMTSIQKHVALDLGDNDIVEREKWQTALHCNRSSMPKALGRWWPGCWAWLGRFPPYTY